MTDPTIPREDEPQSDSEQDGARLNWLASEGTSWLQDLMRSYVFLTRLPLAPAQEEAPSGPISQSMRGFPVVGALIGAVGGGAFLLSDLLGLAPPLSAALAVLALTVITGAIHEQSLAQATGGGDPSSSGVKGMVFVVLVLFIKIACLTHIGGLAWGGPLVVMALIAAGSVSRAAMVGAAFFLSDNHEDAGDDHAGLRTGELYQVPQTQLAQALIAAVIIAVLCFVIGQGFTIPVAGILGAVLASSAAIKVMNPNNVRPADRLGAIQQVSEVVFLLIATALLAK